MKGQKKKQMFPQTFYELRLASVSGRLGSIICFCCCVFGEKSKVFSHKIEFSADVPSSGVKQLFVNAAVCERSLVLLLSANKHQTCRNGSKLSRCWRFFYKQQKSAKPNKPTHDQQVLAGAETLLLHFPNVGRPI